MPNFLDLPREVRDQIYEINLVHGIIPISCTIRFAHLDDDHSCQRDGQQDEESLSSSISRSESDAKPTICRCETCIKKKHFFIHRRDIKRTTRGVSLHVSTSAPTEGTLFWTCHEKSYGQPLINNSGFACWSRQKLTKFDPRGLTLLLASRQLYYEASAVFYSRNKFDFGCRNFRQNQCYFQSLSNALGLLLDRSDHALSHLRKFRLALGIMPQDMRFLEDWNTSDDFKVLCNILTDRCRLNELDIGIFRTGPNTDPALKQLYKIQGLRVLKIWIEGLDDLNESAEEDSVAFIRAFRARSLIGDEAMGVDGLDIDKSYEMGRPPMTRVSTWKPDGTNIGF